MPDSDTDVSELAAKVVDELDPGSVIGDKVILSRRQLVAAAGSTLSVGALMSLGVSEVDAQEAVGQVGTPDSREDAFLATADVEALEAESLDDGVAGTGNSIAGIAGTTGEVVGVASYNILPGEVITISSTSFVQVGADSDRINVNLDRWDLQNAEQRIYISGQVDNLGDGETVNIRFAGQPDTEISASSDGFFAGDWTVFGASGSNSGRLEAQVSAGSVDLTRLQFAIGREIQ